MPAALPARPAPTFVVQLLSATAPAALVALLLLAGCEGATVTTKTPLPDSSQGADSSSNDSGAASDVAAENDAAGGDAAVPGSDAESGNTDCGKVVWEQAKTAFLNNCADCHDVPDGEFKANNCASTATRKSKIKTVVNKNQMPLGKLMSDADKQLIIQWVNDGGLCACP